MHNMIWKQTKENVYEIRQRRVGKDKEIEEQEKDEEEEDEIGRRG